jgi:hypothetical protein
MTHMNMFAHDITFKELMKQIKKRNAHDGHVRKESSVQNYR